MTTATFINITCPACGLASTVPVDALLVSLAVADHDADTWFPQAETDAHEAVEMAGAGAWTCATCADLVSAHIGWTALLTLVTAGATLLDDASAEELPPHPEHPTAGAPLTRDDLLALHELLASDTWFDALAPTGGCRRR
jgi:hypothetical protein